VADDCETIRLVFGAMFVGKMEIELRCMYVTVCEGFLIFSHFPPPVNGLSILITANTMLQEPWYGKITKCKCLCVDSAGALPVYGRQQEL
jgi:hypothetical protein